jgi:hypothetical protein
MCEVSSAQYGADVHSGPLGACSEDAYVLHAVLARPRKLGGGYFLRHGRRLQPVSRRHFSPESQQCLPPSRLCVSQKTIALDTTNDVASQQARVRVRACGVELYSSLRCRAHMNRALLESRHASVLERLGTCESKQSRPATKKQSRPATKKQSRPATNDAKAAPGLEGTKAQQTSMAAGVSDTVTGSDRGRLAKPPLTKSATPQDAARCTGTPVHLGVA